MFRKTAVWGMPVIFGPKYQKFKEAVELPQMGGGFTIQSKEELYRVLDNQLSNKAALKEAGEKAGSYVMDQT